MIGAQIERLIEAHEYPRDELELTFHLRVGGDQDRGHMLWGDADSFEWGGPDLGPGWVTFSRRIDGDTFLTVVSEAEIATVEVARK